MKNVNHIARQVGKTQMNDGFFNAFLNSHQKLTKWQIVCFLEDEMPINARTEEEHKFGIKLLTSIQKHIMNLPENYQPNCNDD